MGTYHASAAPVKSFLLEPLRACALAPAREGQTPVAANAVAPSNLRPIAPYLQSLRIEGPRLIAIVPIAVLETYTTRPMPGPQSAS